MSFLSIENRAQGTTTTGKTDKKKHTNNVNFGKSFEGYWWK